MRFIHVSDINIGANPDSDKSWGKERAGDFKDTLKKVVDKAKEIDCDLLLISGNLFCHLPVTRELSEVNLLFSSIPATRVVIVAGSSDRLRKNSSVLSFKWSSNVSCVLGENFEKIKLPALHTTVYAASQTEEKRDIKALIREMSEEAGKEPEYINILLMYNEAYGDEDAEAEIRDIIAGSSFSYAALGGRHEHYELIRERCAYAGYLSPVGMSTPGEHGILVGDISLASKRMPGFDFIKMADIAYIPIRIEINAAVSSDELERTVAGEIEKRGEKNIYKLKITGKRNPDTVIDFKDLKKRYRIEETVDETEPEYDFSKLFAEHPDDIIGYYISSVMKDDEDRGSLEKRAMYYAVDALLSTERKRS